MKVIISHENLDFDGLASMVACSKLHPDARLFFSGKLNDYVKQFFNLYKNSLSINHANQVDLDEIEELIIVDVSTPNRIGKFKELVDKNIKITIFDHHIQGDNVIDCENKIIKPYGACTTILVQEIISKEISLTSFEATLLAIGIYADTNCLTFNGTIDKDAEAVAFLLSQGANIQIVSQYVQASLEYEQNQLLNELLMKCQEINIKGNEVVIAVSTYDHFIGGLGSIAHRIMDIKRCDGVFLIVKMDKNCYVVGRSGSDNLNIPYILTPFNGGGHERAASATVKEADPLDLKNQLIESLKERVNPQLTAGEMMSHPVKTVYEHMKIQEVNKIMLRYGHTGMPVLEGDQMIGIISRTDVDKAIIHGLGHAPVKGFMTKNVKTINPSTTLKEMNLLLTRNNIGRLPVVEDNQLIGIVTRTDVLKIMYGAGSPYWYKETYEKSLKSYNFKKELAQLPMDIHTMFQQVGQLGDTMGNDVFIVGGFVRDFLLGEENQDLDFVVEGDGIAFAQALNEIIQGRLTIHEKFGTATIQLPDKRTLDVVTARREYYEYPAAMPQVEKSSIWSDLFRRDFTINAMAIQLNKSKFGQLIDYFGGIQDLEDKNIRVLYNLSFVEDPTRIFRAIRFSTRLNFNIEDETKTFIHEAIKDGMLDRLSAERLREEILNTILEKNIQENILSLDRFKVLEIIHPKLQASQANVEKLQTLKETINYFRTYESRPDEIEVVLIVLMHLLSDLNEHDLVESLNKLIANKGNYSKIKETLENRKIIYEQLKQEDLNSYDLYQLLNQFSLESIIYYYNDCDHSYVKHYLLFYVLKLKEIHVEISGEDLIKLGIKPGPIFRIVLERVLEEKVKGNIYRREEEIQFAQQLYRSLKGEKNA
ncbi:Polynucleotide adenylyltransferase region [Alkaliphilus metalliredigens QYMF]|uniref:Polynucleotide adenylyltransferase region n=1 Tax=Alkaliphilus metalliredigens (strain QYMF) TaxID=293826 RepID=A6TR64_ALKMQ|nr:CBS domain-containing protein [Alkaliphilus metalliredigens]ABR48682.1 Polynucleotide adenylyltransferase region [Alkaliphilus metalliredigens QYMF]